MNFSCSQLIRGVSTSTQREPGDHHLDDPPHYARHTEELRRRADSGQRRPGQFDGDAGVPPPVRAVAPGHRFQLLEQLVDPVLGHPGDHQVGSVPRERDAVAVEDTP